MSGSDVVAHNMSGDMDMDEAVPGPDFSDNPVCSGDGKMCGECGKIFSHPFYFSTHISIHASEKNFAVVGQCALCGLTFADAGIFSQHLNSSQNRMAVQMPEEEEDSRDQNSYSDQYDTSQNLEDYNQNGVGMSNENIARSSGENKNNVSSESMHRDHSGGSDFEPKSKRRRKMPERYDPDAISEAPRLHPDEDPAVEAYLMSLTEMGLTVDPAAFASHGKGRSRKSFGPSKGKWKGKRFPSHDPLSGNFFPPRKPSPKYEYVDYDVLLEDDMEILPKSGKQTRGLRLQQRHERLSGEPGGAAPNDTLVKTEEPSAESSSSVRTSTATSSSHPDPVPGTSSGDKMPSRGFALDKLSVKTELIDKDYNPRGSAHTKPKPKAPPQPPKQIPNSQPSPSAEPPPAPRPGLTGYARANPAFRPANSVNPALHANIKRPGTLANPQRMRNPASMSSPSPRAAKSKGIERFKQESREYVEIMLQSLTSELIPTKMGKNPVATKTIYGRPADGYVGNFPGHQPRFPGSRGSSGGPRHNVGRGRGEALFFKGGQVRYQPRPGVMNPPFNEVQGLWSGSSNGTTLHGQSSRWNSNPPVSQRGGAAINSLRGRGGSAMPVVRGGVAMNARGGGAPRKIVPVGGAVSHVSLAGQPRPNPKPGAVFPVQMSRGGSVAGRGAGQAKAVTKTPQPFLNTNEVIVVDDDDEDVNKVSKKGVDAPAEGTEKSVKKSAVILDIDKAENPVADIAVIRDKNKDLEGVSDVEVSKDKKLSLTPAVCLTRIDEVKGEPRQNSPDGKEKTKAEGEKNTAGQDPLLEVEDIEGWKVCLAENSESEASEDENSETHSNQPSPSQLDENKSNTDADVDKVSNLKDPAAGKKLNEVSEDGQKEDTGDGDSIAVTTAPSVPLTFPNFIGDTDNLLDIFSEIEKTCKEIEENSGNEKEDSGTESDAKEMKPTPEYEKPVADPQGEDSWTEPEGEEEEEGNQEELGHKISDILKSLEGGEAKDEGHKNPGQIKSAKESVDGVEGENMFRDEIQNILKSIGETGDAGGSDGGTSHEVKNNTIKDNEKVEDEKKENNQESDIIDGKSPYNQKSDQEENGNESEGYENNGDKTMETDEDESEKQTTVKTVDVFPEEKMKCSKNEQSGLAGQELSESCQAGEPEPDVDPPHHDGEGDREKGGQVMDVGESNTESNQHDEEPTVEEEEKQGKSFCQDEEVPNAGTEVLVEVKKADIQENMETNDAQDTSDEDLHTENNGEVAPAKEIQKDNADKKKSPSRNSCKDSEDLPGDPRDDGGDEDDKHWRHRMERSPPSVATHSFSFTALSSTSTDGTSTSGNSQPSDSTQCSADTNAGTSGNSQPSDSTHCSADTKAGSGHLTEKATINFNSLLSDIKFTLNPTLFVKASHCDVDRACTKHSKNFQALTEEILSPYTDWKQISEQIPSSFSSARLSCVSCHCVRQESCYSPASFCRKLQCCPDSSMYSFMPLLKYASMYKKKRFSSKPLGCKSLSKVLSLKFSRPMVPKFKADKKFKMCLDQFISEKQELKHMSQKLNSRLNVLPARMALAVKSLHNKKPFGKVLPEALDDCMNREETCARSTFLRRNFLNKKHRYVKDSRKEIVGNFKVHAPKLTWNNINTFVPVVYPLTTNHPHAPRALKASRYFSGKPRSIFSGTGAQDKLKSCDGWKVVTCGTQEKNSGTTYQSGIGGQEINRSEGRNSSKKSHSFNSGSNRGDGDGGEDEDNPDDDNISCLSKFFAKCPVCGLKLKSIKIAKRHLATHVSKPRTTDALSSSSKKCVITLPTEAKQNIPPDFFLSSMKSTHANTNLYESVKIPTGRGTTEIIAVKPTLPVVRKHIIRANKSCQPAADTTLDFKVKKKFQPVDVTKGKDSVNYRPLCLISEVRSLQPEISETSPKDGTKIMSNQHVEVSLKRENVQNIQRKSGRAGVKKKDLNHRGGGSCSTDKVLSNQDIQSNYGADSQPENPTNPSLILATTVKSEPLDFASDVSSAPQSNVAFQAGDLQGKCGVDHQSKNLPLFPAVKAEPVELSDVSWSCVPAGPEKNTNVLADQVCGLQTNGSLLGHEFDEKPIDIEVKAEPLTESDDEEDLLTVTFDDNCLPPRQPEVMGSDPSVKNYEKPTAEKYGQNFPYTEASINHVHNDSQNSLYPVPGFSGRGLGQVETSGRGLGQVETSGRGLGQVETETSVLKRRGGSRVVKDKREIVYSALEWTSLQQNKHYRMDDLSDEELIRLGIPLVYVHPTKPVVNLGFPRAPRSTRINASEDDLMKQVSSAVRSSAEDRICEREETDLLKQVTSAVRSSGDEQSSNNKSAKSSDVKSKVKATLVESKGNQVDCVDDIKSSYIASLVGEASYVENLAEQSASADKFVKKSDISAKKSSSVSSAKKSSHTDGDNVTKVKPSYMVPSSTTSDCTQIDKNLAKFPAYQRKTNPSIVYVHPKKPVINFLGRVQSNHNYEPQDHRRSKPYKKVRVGKVTYQIL